MDMQEMDMDSNPQLNQHMVQLMILQFKVMCRAHFINLQVQEKKVLKGTQNEYSFIEEFVVKNSNKKQLLKKISKNEMLINAFKGYLIHNNILDSSFV